jgi:anti-sigma regulatory factor (Ser/Thr protein kinase)
MLDTGPPFPQRFSDGLARELAHGTWHAEDVRQRRIELVGTPSSVHYARTMVEHLVGDSLGATPLADLRLLTSEVVTNAVIHGDAGQGVVLEVGVCDRCVRVEVNDRGAGFAVAAGKLAPGAVGGRGLRVLDMLASRWGIGADEGTCVWFELDLPDP